MAAAIVIRGERAEGSWENHLHAARSVFGASALKRRMSRPFVPDLPDVGRLKPTSARPVVDLPQPDSPTATWSAPSPDRTERPRRHVLGTDPTIPQAALDDSKRVGQPGSPAWTRSARHRIRYPGRLLRHLECR